MIPKIIHHCWLSDDPIPTSMRNYIDGWRCIMPDYELRLWNFERFPKDKSQWVSEAFDARKYAFAADYIRSYALYHEGGIYLDCDVEAIKSFDSLLHLPYAFCFENGSGCIEAGVMMSEPNNVMFARMLKYYDDKGHFINNDGTMNTTAMPNLMNSIACEGMTMVDIKSPKEFDFDANHVSVLPCEYFSPINLETRRLSATKNTYAIHHFAASWVSGWAKHRETIKKLIGPTLSSVGIALKRLIKS